MYLNDILLQEIQPCTAQGNRIKIKAMMQRDISEIFPYLNAEIPSTVYNRSRNWLTFRIGEKIVTLYPERLTVTKLKNETDAYETLDMIQEKINEVYENREKISPDFEMKKMPTPLDLYKLLPKTNCRKCGEMTCLAFAGKLLVSNAKLDRCEMLSKEKGKEYDLLEGILQSYGLV